MSSSAGAVLLAGAAFVALAVAVVSVPARPVDVRQAQSAPVLPAVLGELWRVDVPLSAREASYFTRFGGGAARAGYGEHALLVVRTSAPLRHLHAPDECLRGQGHRVRYLGNARTDIPTAVYRATSPDGREWRIAVSFVSDRGQLTSNVGHAVWLWLGGTARSWTMVQRVSPWAAPADAVARFESHVARAFDLQQRPLAAASAFPANHYRS